MPLGKRMSGTRFIAFKVPLKKSFEWRLAPDERFSPLDLITQVKEQKEELGLIIDLTYTTRYYEPMELPDTLQYCKILTIGHEVPNHTIVSKFKSAVKKFLRENQHNDKLIGVHCTHGLNRTGYLVCRYLIDVEGMDPNRAIELFNRCRGHPIERKHSQIWNQNLITCYSEGNQACSAQHPPSADMMHHRSGHNVRPSNRIFFSQEQFQGYQRPSFQELNPHGSLQQHRNQIDKQHYWTP
uniref:RNA/RNP complex-1-interacting phosphatase n=1 Tax=Micrurus surinamensis TaxID=129470 RepID=A0A2D4PMP4_MICSU